MQNVFVLAEHKSQSFEPITYELIEAARSVGNKVSLLVLGKSNNIPNIVEISRFVNHIYIAEHDLLSKWATDAWTSVLHQVCSTTIPELLLIGKTNLGRDIGPRLAYKLNGRFIQDCYGMQVDDYTFKALRPIYGGNITAEVEFEFDGGTNIAAIRAGLYEKEIEELDAEATIENIEVNLQENDIRVRHIEFVEEPRTGVKLEDASVVVVGGRGLGGPEPFEMLEEIAELLGGAVGASRAACDAGWIDHNKQIGLTGKTVSPNLYITVGVSGASQHMAGCSSAKNIVAINQDKGANIFKEASIGVVGDWKIIIPSLIEELKKRNI
jgi:electron transfer flavoprotein alpha subunit